MPETVYVLIPVGYLRNAGEVLQSYGNMVKKVRPIFRLGQSIEEVGTYLIALEASQFRENPSTTGEKPMRITIEVMPLEGAENLVTPRDLANDIAHWVEHSYPDLQADVVEEKE